MLDPTAPQNTRILQWAYHFYPNEGKINALGVALIALSVALIATAATLYFRPFLPVSKLHTILIAGSGIPVSFALMILGIQCYKRNQFAVFVKHVPFLWEKGLRAFATKHGNNATNIISKEQIFVILNHSLSTEFVYRILGAQLEEHEPRLGESLMNITYQEDLPPAYQEGSPPGHTEVQSQMHQEGSPPTYSESVATPSENSSIKKGPIVDIDNPWGITIKDISGGLYSLICREIHVKIQDNPNIVNEQMGTLLKPLEAFQGRMDSFFQEFPAFQAKFRNTYKSILARSAEAAERYNQDVNRKYFFEPKNLPDS